MTTPLQRHASTPPTPPPVGGATLDTTFESLGLLPAIMNGIRALGFERATPIQAKTIPLILQGRDVIGCAQTGTGKTAAFVLPILHRLMTHGKSRGHVRTLIIAPTRELALQSMTHIRALSKEVPLTGAAIFGGVPMDPQIKALQRGVDIISATPGRLLDHLYSGRIDFVDLQIVVLDEADRMLDMGFMPDIQKIMKLLPSGRQSLMFSATMPPEIAALAHRFLRDPVTVQIGLSTAPADGVRQAVYPVPRHQKPQLLLALLKQEQMDSVLVFTRTKRAADRLFQTLSHEGIQASVMHGDRSQDQRLRALDRFRTGRSRVMVATDVAARGIHIDDISHVVNFDVPGTAEDYVHRCGRTARAQATGDAFTLVDESEEPVWAEIERALKRTVPRLTIDGFNYAAPRPASQGYGGGDHRSRGGFRRPGLSHGGGHGPQYGGRSEHRGGRPDHRARRNGPGHGPAKPADRAHHRHGHKPAA